MVRWLCDGCGYAPLGCSEGLSGSLGAPWWGCLVMRIQELVLRRILLVLLARRWGGDAAWEARLKA